MIYPKIKRLIDIILSGIALILLSPIFLMIAVAIKSDSKGSVLFKQKRVGMNKSTFNILKFRTMSIDTPKDIPTHLLENPDQWITKVGRFLRKTSLDELPQIINIFKGKMSIVGPRPALWNQMDLMEERDKYVGKNNLTPNNIRPGLTGWAQINGRDTVEIADKARFDGYYVANLTFALDWTCFWRTAIYVLKREGIVEGGTGQIDQIIKEEAKEMTAKEDIEK